MVLNYFLDYVLSVWPVADFLLCNIMLVYLVLQLSITYVRVLVFSHTSGCSNAGSRAVSEA